MVISDATTNTIKVLIVDDTEFQREELAETLRRNYGFAVVTACDGYEAIDKVREVDGDYDAVVIDEKMPEMNGIETLRYLHRDYPQLQCIVFTGLGQEAGIEALRTGAFRYFPKSFSDEELAITIRLMAQMRQERIRAREAGWLQVLTKISRSGLEDSKSQVLDKVVTGVHDTLAATCAIAWTLDRGAKKLRVAAAYPELDKAYIDSIDIDVESAATREYLERQSPLYLTDVTEPTLTPRYDDLARQEAIKRGWISMLSAPMVAEGQVVGVLDVYTSTIRRFSQEDGDWLMTFANHAALAIRRTDVEEQRAKLLNRLERIGAMTLEAFDFGVHEFQTELAKQVVEAVHELTYDGVILWLPDENQPQNAPEQYRIWGDAGFTGQHFGNARLTTYDSISGLAMQTRQPVALANIFAEIEGRSIEFIEEASSEGWKSFLTVPLLIPERTLGALSIYSRTQRNFAHWERDLLVTFASQAAVAIEDVKLREQEKNARKQAEELHKREKTLLETTSIIASADTLDATAQAILDEFKKVIDYDRAIIQVIKGDKRRQIAERPLGLLDENYPSIYTTQPMSKDRLISEVIRTKKSLILSDPSENIHWDDILATRHIGSWVCAPLVFGGQVLGLLILEHRQPRYYNAKIRDLLQAFANQAAVALENALRNEELRLLQDVSVQMSQTLELDEILKVLVEGAIQVIDVESGVVHVLSEAKDRIIQSYGYPEAFNHPEPRHHSEGYTISIVKQERQIIVDDVQSDQQTNPQVIEQGVKSFIGTPLILSKMIGKRPIKSVLGVLYLNEATSIRHFTKRECGLLRTLAAQAAVAIQKSTQYASEQARAVQLEQLLRLTKDITENPTQDEILLLQSITQQLSHTYEGAACTIRLLNEEDIWTAYDVTTKEVHEEPIRGEPRQDGTTMHVLRIRAPLYIEDTANIQIDRLNVRAEFEQVGVQSLACLPLIDSSRLIGILYLEFPELHRFSGEERNILEVFAEQVTIAIRNTRQAKTLTMLNEAFTELATIVNLKTTMEIVVEEAREIMRAHTVMLYQYDASKQEVILPLLSTGLRYPEIICTAHEISHKYIVSSVARSGETRFITDARESTLLMPDIESRDDYHDFIMRENIRSFAAIPLHSHEAVVGVLLLYYRTPRLFDDDERKTISLFATAAASAIDNARLYKHISEDLEKRIHELEVVNEIGKAISSTEINDITDLVHEQMNKIINLDDALVQFAVIYGDEVRFPLAIEKNDGVVIDLIRWGQRDSDGTPVKQFVDRPFGTRYGLTEYIIDLKEPHIHVEEFKIDSPEDVQVRVELPLYGEEGLVSNFRTIKLWRSFGAMSRPTNSWIGVPMVIQDRVIGVISIQSLGENPPLSKDHLTALEIVASQAAVAIENAKLYEQLSRQMEELEKANSELLALDKRKSEFLATVSHELRDPLTPIKGVLQNALEGIYGQINNDMLQDRLSVALDSVHHEAGLIDNLLDLVRIQEGKVVLDWQKGNLYQVLENVVRVFIHDARHKQIHLEIILPSDNCPYTCFDQAKIKQVFSNLISNAIKFTGYKGSVQVNASCQQNFMRVQVADNGIGIPKNQLLEIFERFHQVDGTDTRKFGGMGIGLHIVKEYVEMHGGSIDVESEENKGSIFTVELPLEKRSNECEKTENLISR